MRVFCGIVLLFFFVLAEIPFNGHSPVFAVSSCVFTNARILYAVMQQSGRDQRIVALLETAGSFMSSTTSIVFSYIIAPRIATGVVFMCKVSEIAPGAYFPFDEIAGEDGREFERNTPPIALDRIFKVDVRKSTTPEEVEYHAKLIGRIQAKLNIDIVELKDNTRSNLDVQSNEFCMLSPRAATL